MGNFLIGSFYTKNTPYEIYIQDYLLASCKKFNLDYHVVGIESLGSWTRNVAEKPGIILKILEESQDKKDVVFLDADSTIEQELIVFNNIDKDIDLALHYLDWNAWYPWQKGSDVKELLSGTLFLRNNERVKSLVEEWHKRAITSTVWEQKILEQLLKERPDIKVFDLPIEYCYIKTLPNGQEPIVKVQPVILHHQKSREAKRLIK